MTQFKLCCLKRMIDWWTSRLCPLFLWLIHATEEKCGDFCFFSLHYSAMNACSLILLSLTLLLGFSRSWRAPTKRSVQCIWPADTTRGTVGLIFWSIKYSTTWISLLQNQIAHALLHKCSCIYMRHESGMYVSVWDLWFYPWYAWSMALTIKRF